MMVFEWFSERVTSCLPCAMLLTMQLSMITCCIESEPNV